MVSISTIREAIERASQTRTYILTNYGSLMSYEDYKKSLQEQ